MSNSTSLERARAARQASRTLLSLDTETRSNILTEFASLLESHEQEILTENKKDLDAAAGKETIDMLYLT